MDVPVKKIACGPVSAEIALPDLEKGYYRGTRFDHLGVFTRIEGGDHVWVEPWFDGFDPLRHDHVCGPVDEFTPVGLEDPGDTFVKIGVGRLRKKEEPYDRFLLYEREDAGEVGLESAPDSLFFCHSLDPAEDGLGYVLGKRISLLPPAADDAACAAVLELKYALKNTGARDLDTDWYNHNFFTLDHQEVGPDTEIRLPWTPEGHWRDPYSCIEILENGFRFTDVVASEGRSVYMGDLHPAGGAAVTGWTPSEEARYGFRITNRKTGCGVEAEGTGKMDFAVFWSCPRVSCLEPYVHLHAAPGACVRWKMTYRLMK